MIKSFHYLFISGLLLFFSCSNNTSMVVLPSLSLEFQRLPESNNFYVIIDSSDGLTHAPVIQGEGLSIDSPVQQVDGTWRSLVLPPRSGEWKIQASSEGYLPVEETALVMHFVHEEWGQPVMIPGPFVNTLGWEDGVTISSDGEYLYLQYSPMPFSTDWDKVQKVSGPLSSPIRPDFFRNRIDDNGDIYHSFPLYSVTDEIPGQIFPMSSFYGFRRDSEGIFSQPFLIGINDGENGNLNPFGFYPMDLGQEDQLWAFMAFNDPRTNDNEDSGNDIYAFLFSPGQKNILGEYFNGDWVTSSYREILRNEDFAPILLDMQLSGGQGNPQVYRSNQNTWLFTDDEVLDESQNHEVDISFYILEGDFPQGPWAGPFLLPEEINRPDLPGQPSREVQPFFDGEYLYYNANTQIYRNPYISGPLNSSSSWGERETFLQGMEVPFSQGEITLVPGNIYNCGEPSLYTKNGESFLYFIYSRINADYSLDLNVGYIKKR